MTGDAFDGDFVVRLVIQHPVLTLDEICKEMGVEPESGHNVGDARCTPTGRLLEGVWQETLWSHTKRFAGRRDFFAASLELVDTFKNSESFIRSISDGDGSVILYIDLNGWHSFGDTIRPEHMGDLASLGIQLGVEVFP